MAYSATITAVERVINGRTHLRIEIAETDAATASEWSYGDSDGEFLPPVGTITSYQAELVSGTGTTIAPRLGKVTAWNDGEIEQISQSPTPADNIHDQGQVRYVADAGARPVIFGRSTVDAGTDNVITTVIEIVGEHGS